MQRVEGLFPVSCFPRMRTLLLVLLALAGTVLVVFLIALAIQLFADRSSSAD